VVLAVIGDALWDVGPGLGLQSTGSGTATVATAATNAPLSLGAPDGATDRSAPPTPPPNQSVPDVGLGAGAGAGLGPALNLSRHRSPLPDDDPFCVGLAEEAAAVAASGACADTATCWTTGYLLCDGDAVPPSGTPLCVVNNVTGLPGALVHSVDAAGAGAPWVVNGSPLVVANRMQGRAVGGWRCACALARTVCVVCPLGVRHRGQSTSAALGVGRMPSHDLVLPVVRPPPPQLAHIHEHPPLITTM
jgi:hypothetical protein